MVSPATRRAHRNQRSSGRAVRTAIDRPVSPGGQVDSLPVVRQFWRRGRRRRLARHVAVNVPLASDRLAARSDNETSRPRLRPGAKARHSLPATSKTLGLSRAGEHGAWLSTRQPARSNSCGLAASIAEVGRNPLVSRTANYATLRRRNRAIATKLLDGTTGSKGVSQLPSFHCGHHRFWTAT